MTWKNQALHLRSARAAKSLQHSLNFEHTLINKIVKHFIPPNNGIFPKIHSKQCRHVKKNNFVALRKL